MFVALAMMLVVQVWFPAHLESHPIGSLHVHCDYCGMAGHAVGMPGSAIKVSTAPTYAQYQTTKAPEFQVQSFPRTRFSRAPPLTSIV